MEIVVVTHGEMSIGLMNSCNMYYGKLDNVHPICLLPDMSIEEFKRDFYEFMDSLGERILVLCDIEGGTPFNTACEYNKNSEKEIAIITGVNLPMLIDSIDRLREDGKLINVSNDIIIDTISGIKLITTK